MGSQGTYVTEQSSRSRVLIRRIDVEVPLSPSAPALQDGTMEFDAWTQSRDDRKLHS
jgi:hypothetical protein